jgi:dodecin
MLLSPPVMIGRASGATTSGLRRVSIFAIMQRGPATAIESQGRQWQIDAAGPFLPHFSREAHMPIVRNIDVTMQSEVSFDDACRAAVAEAAKTLRGIMSFRIKEAECVIEHDKVIAFRVTGKIVFLVER